MVVEREERSGRAGGVRGRGLPPLEQLRCQTTAKLKTLRRAAAASSRALLQSILGCAVPDIGLRGLCHSSTETPSDAG